MVDGHGPPDGFVFEALDEVAEGVVVAAVDGGDVEAGVALPEAPAGLGAAEVSEFVGEFEVVACEAGVEFPVPDEFVFGVGEGEVLDGEPLGAVDAVYMYKVRKLTGLYNFLEAK